MRRAMRRALTAAAMAMAATAATLVAAGPATAAAPPGCPNNYLCLYEHNNFNRDRSGGFLPVPVGEFRNCGSYATPILNGRDWISSVYNNTDAHLQLWDTGSNPDYLVGTAMRRKGYGYLGARGNDTTDYLVGVGCK